MENQTTMNEITYNTVKIIASVKTSSVTFESFKHLKCYGSIKTFVVKWFVTETYQLNHI